MMQYEDDLSLDPEEQERLEARQAKLRAAMSGLRKAAEDEEPLSDVTTLEDT